MPNCLSSEDINDMLNMHDRGLKMPFIAEYLGTTREYVRRCLFEWDGYRLNERLSVMTNRKLRKCWTGEPESFLAWTHSIKAFPTTLTQMAGIGEKVIGEVQSLIEYNLTTKQP